MRRRLTSGRPAGLVLGVLLLAVPLLGACSSAPTSGSPGVRGPTGGAAVTSDDVPSRSSTGPAVPTGSGVSTTAAGCGGRSTSPGPAGSLVVVGLSAPATAPVGTTVTVSVQLVVLSSGPRIVLSGRGSAVEILRGSAVVGRAVAADAPDVPLPLTAGASYPGQTLPTEVPLVGCDGAPLPAGAYQLRAVVTYGGDPLDTAPSGSAGAFVLVSDPPVDLTVT